MPTWCVKLVSYSPQSTVVMREGLKEREAVELAWAIANTEGGYRQKSKHRWVPTSAGEPYSLVSK
jgi:hypothetical protein